MATQFVCSIKPSGGDYSTLSSWEAAIDCNLTTAKVFSYSEGEGPIPDGATVEGESSLASGTALHVTATQILIVVAYGTFISGEVVRDTAVNGYAVTITDAGDSVIAVAKIDGDWSSADTTAVTIVGWTTDATRYINIYTTATARHKGIYSTSYYLLAPASGTCLTLNNSNTTIDGLQIGFTRAANYTFGISVALNSGTGFVIKNNIVRAIGTATNCSGIALNNLGMTANVYNNIIYGAWGYACIFKNDVSAGTLSIYNNTCYGATRGIWLNRASDTTSMTLKNNICNDNTTDYQVAASATFNSASTYNITNDTPAAVHSQGVAADSGTTDGSTTAFKLIQSGQNFVTTIKVGMIVKNTTDTAYSYVTAVDSDTQLTLNDDIMATAEAYTIYTNMFGRVSFVNETAGSEDLHLGSTDTVAMNKGANLYADATIAITTDIDGEARPDSATLFDIGADEYVAVAATNPCFSGTSASLTLLGAGDNGTYNNTSRVCRDNQENR